jgi:hypothetical protein
MAALDFKALVAHCDECLRTGQIHRVHQTMARVPTAQVPREWRLPLARICRRATLIATGMRLLSPVVRPSNGRKSDATEREIAEYSVLLIRTGAVKEALSLLERINAEAAPESLLFRAFGHFTDWDYAPAVPLLERYLRADLPEYQSFIGKVNLASALVATDREEEALPLLASNIEYALSHGHSRLRANCLEMRAQLHIRHSRYAQALKDLEQAAKDLGGSQTNDQLFVRKWLAVTDALMSGNPEPIEKFCEEASARREWDSLRDAHLQSLRVDFDRARFNFLYFGTPFASYRMTMERILGQKPDTQVIELGRGKRVLDFVTGKLPADLKDGQGRSPHQVLEILLRDFYRPLNAGGLFSALFPNESFNIFSSPGRVHQALRRTRQWIARHKLPLELNEEGGVFRIETGAGVTLRLPLVREPVEEHFLKLRELRDRFGRSEYFSTADVSKASEFSRATLKRFLRWAVDEGHLHQFGEARATRYYFAA